MSNVYAFEHNNEVLIRYGFDSKLGLHLCSKVFDGSDALVAKADPRRIKRKVKLNNRTSYLAIDKETSDLLLVQDPSPGNHKVDAIVLFSDGTIGSRFYSHDRLDLYRPSFLANLIERHYFLC